MKYLVQFYYEMRYLFRINILFLTFLLVGISQVFAQEVKTTSSSNQESTIYDQMQIQSDTIVETPTQLEDIPMQELEALDLSTIPESVPVSDADWVFEVPVNVKNIPVNIQNIGVKVIVYRWKSNGRSTIAFGVSQTKVKLVNGTFEGNVLVGVSYDEDLVKETRRTHETLPPNKAQSYWCGLYLIGSDNSWMAPSLEQANPTWRMADANQPFSNWQLGALPRQYGSNQ